MGRVTVKDGRILLVSEDQPVLLNAEDVFAIVFEGATSAHGTPLTCDDLKSTGLVFREFSADPVVIMQALVAGSADSVSCRLVARGMDFEADVASQDGLSVDYAIDGDVWMPLPAGTVASVSEFINRAGIPGFGPITLGQYLRIQSIRDLPLFIEDKTDDALSASRLITLLGGETPDGFVGSLYPYQLAGYHWLSFIRKNGLGCIIADEMGLGKTIQVICLLLEVKQNGGATNLIIAPATLLENWRRELKRFSPGLSILVHHGSARTGFPEDLQKTDIVLTSYETAVSDISLLRNLAWEILVIDEAQAIKNPSAKRTRQIKTIPRSCAVAMTGTPLENRLTDLWSVTDFAVPGLLGDQSGFERRYKDSYDSARSLEPVITPLILRRRVSEVARDLPERINIPQPLDLDAQSAEVYEMLRQSADTTGGATLATLLRLRMFCTHPWLADQFLQIPTATDCSVKLQRLLEIMEEVASCDDKALIFTSFQKSNDLLVEELETRLGIDAVGIDGRIPIEARQPIIDRFSELPGAAALVLNPRAAGTGLNITAASHVIHFNLEWNPAVEDQATARAYRRGQNKNVTIHRMFYVDTVDEVINGRMERKRQLADAAVVGSNASFSDAKDILRALHISPMRGMPKD